MFKRLCINSDLSRVALKEAVRSYKELQKYSWDISTPTTLCIGKTDFETATELLVEDLFKSLELKIIAGLPLDAWFICGKAGVIYSEGA